MAKRSGRFLQKMKLLIPLLIFVAGIAFVIAWEFGIKDTVNTVEAVVAKDTIEFKDIIQAEDLSIVKMRKDNNVESGFRPDEVENIIGQLASIDIAKGTQIYPDLIDSNNLVPDEEKGEFIAPLPDEWLFAVAGSLRRAYIADIYVVGGENQAMIESLVQDAKEQQNNSEENEQNETENDETIVTNKEQDNAIQELYKPILKDVRISSVKDKGNSEVTESTENPNSATGSVSNLEIIADNEMLTTLQEYTDKGYKLYVVHKFSESSKSIKEEGDKQ